MDRCDANQKHGLKCVFCGCMGTRPLWCRVGARGVAEAIAAAGDRLQQLAAAELCQRPAHATDVHVHHAAVRVASPDAKAEQVTRQHLPGEAMKNSRSRRSAGPNDAQRVPRRTTPDSSSIDSPAIAVGRCSRLLQANPARTRSTSSSGAIGCNR